VKPESPEDSEEVIVGGIGVLVSHAGITAIIGSIIWPAWERPGGATLLFGLLLVFLGMAGKAGKEMEKK